MNFDDLIFAFLACIGLGILIYIAMTLENILEELKKGKIK